MIVVYLKGGLGNQMFQYAVGRHLAHIHNTELKMDISAYDYDGPLEYALEPFNVNTGFAVKEEIDGLKTVKASKLEVFLYNLFHKSEMRAKSFIRFNKTYFNPEILKQPDNIYLEGYFNSEKYFLGIEDIMRSEFTLKEQPSGKNAELADRIKDCNSVSVHIRRGDYIADPTKHTSHGTCELDYYYNCIAMLAEKVSQPEFFVFSDSAEWCHQNLNLEYPATYIDHNDMEHCHEDMRLMSMCNHNIIANSTFSWWGAWLNNNPDKIVFAPRQWFVRADKKTDDIVPKSWVRL